MRNHLDSSPGGYALPMVIVLLLVGTLGGAAVASVAFHQARGAGALHSSVIALHMAESGAAYVVNGLASGEIAWPADGTYAGADVALLGDASLVAPGHAHGSGRWWVDSVTVSGDQARIWITGEGPTARAGQAGGSRRTVEIEYARGTAAYAMPFGDAVRACNGIHLKGSATIDSYDSRSGPYNAASARANATVTTLNGDITLPGNTKIRGNVYVNGNLTYDGSGSVFGEVITVGDITFGGGTPCPTHNVRAGGTVHFPGSWWCTGQRGLIVQNANVPPPPDTTCDILNVYDYVDAQLATARTGISSYQSGNYSGWLGYPVEFNQNVAFQSGLSVGPNDLVFDAGTVDQIFVDGDLRLGSSGTIRIRAPSTPGSSGHVRIFVDGDMVLNGGAKFIVEDGASVEFLVTGKVDIAGGLTNDAAPTIVTNDQPKPSIAIYTSFSGADGVRLGGSVTMFASVYAPNTKVTTTGSGAFHGSIVGGYVSIEGSGAIHFDEALADAQVGKSTVATQSKVLVWTELLRRS